MKLRFNKDKWKKIAIVVLFLLVLPFLPEMMLMVDIVGIEIAITFLVFYLKHHWQLVWHYLHRLKAELIEIYCILTHAYLFQPKVYFSHVSVSVLILVVTGSTVFSTLIWTPAVFMSAGGLGLIT